MSLLLLTVTLRGISNSHCLLSLFSFLGASGVFFNEIPVSKQNTENSSRWDTVFCGITSVLFCLPMSHKKDDRLIWVTC